MGLFPAFENTETGIPYPWVNLKTDFPPDSSNETWRAGASSLLVELGNPELTTGGFHV